MLAKKALSLSLSLLIFIGGANTLSCATCSAEELVPPSATTIKKKLSFIRVLRNEQEEPTAFQTAIVSYSPTGQESAYPRLEKVDLIGAVHVADRKYFEALNDLFTKYDQVLYELVAPEGSRPIPSQKKEVSVETPLSLVSIIQTQMKDLLELTFQLDIVDYEKPNFVHADMSPEQLRQAFQNGQESVWKILGRLFLASSLASSKSDPAQSEFSLLLATLSRHRAQAIKRILAGQLEQIEQFSEWMEGPNGTPLIARRNEVALKKLEQALKGGAKRVAIFYGAAHLPDFSKRLQEEFGLVPVEERWLTAWGLGEP